MPQIELLTGVAATSRDEWNALVGGESPFLEWDWLATLEESGTLHERSGWAPRPLVAREGGRLVAAAPLYVKGNSEGEFVFDWGWADAAYRAGIEYYPKLLVGVPFTPVSGARVLVRPGEDRAFWIARFGEALRKLCVDNELSSAHVNFCRPDEVEPLERAGFDLRVGVQYHWHNDGYADFEDYLARFRSKRRNQVRRERRALEKQGVRIVSLQGDQIPASLAPVMFRLYRSTIDKKYYGRQYLNERFFELVVDRFRERLCLILALEGDRAVAGTFNVQKGDALYGRYWGTHVELRHLHFNVCYYGAVEHCIAKGLRRFEPGAGGEYKQVRGFDAVPTLSLHYVADPRFRAAVVRFLREEREHADAEISWLRENSALKPSALKRTGAT